MKESRRAGDAKQAACLKHANKYAYYPVTVGHPRLSFSYVFLLLMIPLNLFSARDALLHPGLHPRFLHEHNIILGAA
jgi:hypothetical protein